LDQRRATQNIVAQRIRPNLHLRVVRTIAHQSAGARILVVDDNEAMRRTLRGLLEAHDHWKVCDEASSGLEAVAKFDEQKFDIIVLDLQMPGMNGLDAAKEIRSRSPSTPILMVTMHDSPQFEQEARKAGIRGICPKTDIQCLVEGIATILDNKPSFKR